MKRITGTLVLCFAAAIAAAQTPFTIVRPYDGSRVRETIHVMVPKGAVPDGAYVGLYAGGKFLKATSQPSAVKGKFDIYDIDSKALKLPDGPLPIEVVLYQQYDDVTRVVARSSVNVTVENSAASFIPQNGVYLRYNWQPGTYSLYDVGIRVITDAGSDAQAKLGGIASEQSQDIQHIRMKYTCLNRYSNGDGLVSLQPLPPAGHEAAYVQLGDSQGSGMYTTQQMANLYMRLTSLGIQKWGSIPFPTSMPGTSGGVSSDPTNILYADFPLPTLPYEKVKLGSSWPARFLDGKLDLSKIYTQDSLVSSFPARGQFLKVEWTDGHPCALIENTIAAGELSEEDAKKLKATGSAEGAKLSLDEKVWFSLDTHQVIKIDRRITTQVPANFAQSGYGSAGAPGGAPSGGRPGPMGGPTGGPGMPGGPVGRNSDVPMGDQQLSPMGKRGGGGSGKFGSAGLGTPGGFGGFGRGTGGSGSTSVSGYVSQTIELVFTLVK